MKTENKEKRIRIRIVICFLVILFGIIGLKVLSGFKKPPVKVEVSESSLKIEAVRVIKKDYPVYIYGYGEVLPLNIVPVSSEVGGKIVEIHSRLEVGEIIPKGETLFRVDPRDYLTAVRTGSLRFDVLERNSALAKKEYERVSRLYTENNVGSESGVDRAEKAMLEANNLLAQLEQALETAELNLERCEIKAKFDGRIKEVYLENGQYVAPGQKVLTIVDDSVLEIHVPIDSRDARKWLSFKNDQGKGSSGWFSGLIKLPCSIRWTEDDSEQAWEGILHRVVRFNEKTRTLTVAVRIKKDQKIKGNEKRLPLVEGMFCFVTIPGKIINDVVRLPRWAVSFENTVHIAADNRLKTVPVSVQRIEGDHIYVSKGLEEGDLVITTRLADPLENALLEVTEVKGGEDQS